MRRLHYMRAGFVLLLLWAFTACTPDVHALSNGVAWVLRSDAYKACVAQAYADASCRLRELAAGAKSGGWCVVLDADETIISNAAFEAELDEKGTVHSDETWTAWCNREAATLLPGAREYCALVKSLGGRVIIITNREAPVRAATLKNLDRLGLPYDLCIFREGPYLRDSLKTTRRADIEAGEIKMLPGEKRLPPLRILMLAGDQMHDLYNPREKGFEQMRERFGKDLVAIPNPMYGDFMKQPKSPGPKPKDSQK
ncbi:MAG: hypothetical protein NT045_08635 [Candidatus Aureabacteria bacterium]|nr:hypothetical protein [Candidatus Auribacterota bacterium]